MTLDLVLARFKESVEWTRCVPDTYRVLCYDASGDLPEYDWCKVIAMPDVGQETGAIVQHVLLNYDTLADMTVFSQADPAPHVGGSIQAFHDALQRIASIEPQAFVPIGISCPTGRHDHLARRLHLHHPKNPHMQYGDEPLEDACQFLFQKSCPESFTHPFGNIWAASRDAIRSRSFQWWERLMTWCCHCNRPFECGIMEKLFVLALTGY